MNTNQVHVSQLPIDKNKISSLLIINTTFQIITTYPTLLNISINKPFTYPKYCTFESLFGKQVLQHYFL